MSLFVLETGLHSLVVDAGRSGTRALGVPVGGAADRAAFDLGNALVGNDPNAPALEVSFAGSTLRADRRTACVLFGAPFGLAIANRGPVPAGTTFTLEPGDALKIGGTPAGARAYLCVGGGFDMPVLLGSRSGLDPVRGGENLPCGESQIPPRSLPFVALDGFENVTLRVLPGPQFDWFLKPDVFFDTPYEVTPASNRMGVRVRGEALERRPGELASEPVAAGAVQVTNDGQPVILGADGQTIGGYPKIAHVIRADLDRLGQLRPGVSIRFARVTPAEAEAAAVARAAVVSEWVVRLTATRRI